MTNGNGHNFGGKLPAWILNDRRKDARVKFKVELIEPVDLAFAVEGSKRPQTQPAILINISAGGMLLMTFMEPPHVKHLKMTLDLPGLKKFPVEGSILRVVSKGPVYSLGIRFTKISPASRKAIATLAEQHEEQEAHEAVKRLVAADRKRMIYREVLNAPAKKKSAGKKKRKGKKRSGPRSRR